MLKKIGILCIMNPMRAHSRPLVLLLALSLLLATGIPAQAQAQDFRYFSETGHNVYGEFLHFYQQASNPLLIYGYPITEEFTRSGGLRVQYFQRARFEYHPEMPAGRRVILTPLGTDSYIASTQINIYSPLSCRYFAATGYSVCFEFLQFFDTNGGVAQFGLPVSPFEYRDDTIVQYFENARLEWQPWREPGQRVVIADLGRIYFGKAGEDPGLLPPSQPLNAGTEPLVLSLQVRAFVSKAVAHSDDRQAVFIVVRDQRGKPIADANCTSNLTWPDQRTESALQHTDAAGVATISLAFTGQPEGRMVYADVSCTYNGLQSATSTSFRIWY